VRDPVAGCDAALQQLKDAGHSLAILSNTNPAHLAELQPRCAFFESFDHAFFSYQIGIMKPDPAIYHHVLTATNTAPTDAWFFDDGQRNITAAAALGINAIRVDTVAAAPAFLGLAGGS
jgi:HAD superfamily hydrolase (TIGR01509 family)